MQKGDTIICINDGILATSGHKPALVKGQEYPLKEILISKNGEQHFDVGLKSNLGHISDYKSGEELERSGPGEIHWCHSSRFEFVTK